MYITTLLICTILCMFCVGTYYHSKNKTVELICNHPELSDEKVKSLTEMMVMQHKENFKYLPKQRS